MVKEETKALNNAKNDIQLTEISYSVNTNCSAKDNLDLFIGAYKEFDPPVTNKAYKIIIGNHDVEFSGTTLEVINCGDKNDMLDDMFYSEIYMFKKLIDMNYPFKEYVGFCHYRKYFSFMDEIPDLDEMFKTYDSIVGKPIISRAPVKKLYGICHNIEDLEIVEKIINEKYPYYIKPCNAVLNKNIFIPYNMFIMKRDDFKKYVEFVWGVLDEYLNIVGRNIFKRIVDNKEKYLKRMSPNNTIEYQYRIGGYISERLTNIFLVGNFKKMKTYSIVVTEKKYPNEKRAEIKKKIVKEIEKKKEQAV